MKGLMAQWPAGAAVHVAHTQNVVTHVTAGSHRQLHVVGRAKSSYRGGH